MSQRPWSTIGISRLPAQRDRFVLTDNLSGWFEGFTHSSVLGQGYMVRDVLVFKGWSTTINGRPLDRDSKAYRDTVYPWGHRVDYPGVTEEVLLHSGHRILSLRVTTDLPAAVEVCPRLLAKMPPGLKCELLTQTEERRVTVHLLFGESADELRENRKLAKASASWEAEVEHRWASLNATTFVTNDEAYNKALFWAAASARSLVTTEFGTGIWAGLPWFKDNWGRDTFIALPGTLLVTGQFDQARAVLENFARRQNTGADKNAGRIPNRVTTQEILYNTVDGTPWMIRELWEYAQTSGDLAFALSQRPLIRRYVDGALKTYVDAEGLMRHDDADTWMDARIEGKTPWSPRGDRAVEIQVLWITALRVGAALAKAAGDATEQIFFAQCADKAQAAFFVRFEHEGLLVDRLDAEGVPDASLRPNALLAVSIPFEPLLPAPLRDKVVSHTVTRLLLPQGLLSLDPAHRDFHPQHERPASWHKDAAYHNGTIWGWNAGFAVSALAACGWQDRAWPVTQNLAEQILGLGAVGTMSELLDAVPDENGRLVPTGTYSQAWSVSEFARNAWQDYLGYHPRLVEGLLEFSPRLPSAWTTLRAKTPVAGKPLEVEVAQHLEAGHLHQVWVFKGSKKHPPVQLDGKVHSWKSTTLRIERNVPIAEGLPPFAVLPPGAGTNVLAGSDVLRHRREGTNRD